MSPLCFPSLLPICLDILPFNQLTDNVRSNMRSLEIVNIKLSLSRTFFSSMRLGNSDHLFCYSFSYQDCQKFWSSTGNWFKAVKAYERKEHETDNAEQKNANLPQICNLSLGVFSCKMKHYFFVEFVILSNVLILVSILFSTWNKLLVPHFAFAILIKQYIIRFIVCFKSDLLQP